MSPNPVEIASAISIRLVDLLRPGVFWEETWQGAVEPVAYFEVGPGTAWGTTGALPVDLIDAGLGS